MPNDWDKNALIILKRKKDPDLPIDSNLGQKSGNVWNANRLVGDDAGDLQLDDEGREDGVGGWVRTNETIGSSQICKRNKKVLISNDSKSVLLSIQLMQQRVE
jgi:hypothetical protein